MAIRLGPMAESRLYKIAHCNLLRSELCLPYSKEPNTEPRHHRIGSARNFSTGHCSLRPIPRVVKILVQGFCLFNGEFDLRLTEPWSVIG